MECLKEYGDRQTHFQVLTWPLGSHGAIFPPVTEKEGMGAVVGMSVGVGKKMRVCL